MRNRMTAGPVVAERVTWWTISDWASRRMCWEHTRTGKCSCHRKRGGKTYNPCNVTDEVLEDIAALAIDEQPPHGVDLHAWVSTRCCNRHPNCNHKACNEATPILEFLAQRRRAAAAA